MSLFEILLPRAEIDFAKALAEKIVLQFPAQNENKLAKKGGQRRLEAILETVMEDINSFQEKYHLGWFRKARLGNAFRWSLIEYGYSKKFVDALTDGLIHNLAIKK